MGVFQQIRSVPLNQVSSSFPSHEKLNTWEAKVSFRHIITNLTAVVVHDIDTFPSNQLYQFSVKLL